MVSTIAANCNAYVSSDDLTGGHVATSYMGLVPFEAVNAGDVGFVQSDVDNKDYNYVRETIQRSLCNKCHVKDRGDVGFGGQAGTGDAGNPGIRRFKISGQA